MKSNWKWIYNPFEKVAGWKAFGIGILLLTIATVMGYFGNTVFYGLEVKVVSTITWSMAFFLQALGLVVLVAMMYAAALFFARHVRFQDILGTITLAKYPLLLMAVLNLALNKSVSSIDINKLISRDFSLLDILPLFLFGIFAVLLLVWEIALLYNAFRVSTNLKGTKCAVLFTAALLVSEIITIILVFVIY